jgi:hypothetical protein
MTIDELIERLEDYRDAMGGDAEVRLMTQEAWPFENTIAGVVSLDEIPGDPDDEPDSPGDGDDVVYILEGRQLGYGAKAAWQAVR